MPTVILIMTMVLLSAKYTKIGSEPFVREYPHKLQQKIVKGFENTSGALLLDLGHCWQHPEIPPCRKILWILTFACFQSMGDYWFQFQHVRPDYIDIEDFVR